MNGAPYKTFEQVKTQSDKSEEFVVNYLNTHGYQDARRINSEVYFPYFDIVIPSAGYTIEVKYDIASSKTQNVAVEVSEKQGQPSGLGLSMALYYYHIYSYCDSWYIGVISTSELRYIIENNYGVVGYGYTKNHYYTKNVLIDKDYFQQRCSQTINISNMLDMSKV